MMQPVVLDVETQMTFREAQSSDPGKLKISVAGLYDYASNKYLIFEEHELSEFFKYLENASYLIGYNIIDFDLLALKPYYLGDIKRFATIDLIKYIEKSLGFRLALDDLVRETFKLHKTGHGLLAIEYFRGGQMEKLKKYCLSDVELTKKLYEYGRDHHQVYYKSASGRQIIKVDWNMPAIYNPQINLTMPW